MIQKVAVAGAGTMGLGIAQVIASSGFPVSLFDVNETQVSAALRVIESNLSFLETKNKMNAPEKAEILSRIVPVHSLKDLSADLVIEAAVEKLEIKQELFAELEKVNGKYTILATNTSSISVTRIAEVLAYPSRFIGIHFFNPADRMKLVEIISGEKTDPQVVKEIHAFANRIGKTSVAAKDSPGFIVNRVARHFYGEALRLLEEKTAEVPVIDSLLRSAGYKMGPFELMDLIGVETNLAVTQSVYEGFHEHPKFRPSMLQQKLVGEGHFGRKTGRGFYEYGGKKS